jgi:hypothetical protein
MGGFEPDQYPHLTEMATDFILQPGYNFGNEFEIGLNLILDALTSSLPATDGGDQPAGAKNRSSRTRTPPR